MPSTGSADLAQQLRQHGSVSIGLHRGKVAFALVLLIGGPTAFLIGFGSEGTPQLLIAASVSLMIWVGIGLTLPEWVFGAGPVLLIDRTGLTVRRWGQPLKLEWTDMLAVTARPQPRSFITRWIGPSMQIVMSEWVWHDYRASRPRWIALVERVMVFPRGTLIPFKVFTVPHARLIEVLSPELIEDMTTPHEPYRLVLDFSEAGESPLWLRGGRNANLDQLRLPEDLRAELTRYQQSLLALADNPPESAGGELDRAAFDARLAPLMAEARALAPRIAAALGVGSTVIVSDDVPIWPGR